MPIYEYQCKKCKHKFEKIQKFSDPHTKKCPKCKGPVEQLIHAAAVQFKGGGWYATDYAGKGAPKSDGAKDGGESGATENKADKAEPKTETKAESKDEKKSASKKKK